MIPFLALMACGPGPGPGPEAPEPPLGGCVGEGQRVGVDGESGAWFTEWRDAELRLTDYVFWIDERRADPSFQRTWVWDGDRIAEERGDSFLEPFLSYERDHGYDLEGRLVTREFRDHAGGALTHHQRDDLDYDPGGQILAVLTTNVLDGHLRLTQTTWSQGRQDREDSYAGEAGRVDDHLAYAIWTYDAPAPALDFRQERFQPGEDSPYAWLEQVHDDEGHAIASTSWNPLTGTTRLTYTWDAEGRKTSQTTLSEGGHTVEQTWTYDARGLLVSHVTETDTEGDGVIDYATRVTVDWACDG